jgi:hypothetical protein
MQGAVLARWRTLGERAAELSNRVAHNETRLVHPRCQSAKRPFTAVSPLAMTTRP